MTALLTAIALWLSANFNLPPLSEPPKIELVSPARIMAIRHQAFNVERRHDIAAMAMPPVSDSCDTVAVYDDSNRTIYLPLTWTGGTAADLSMLVHEMVHHLQNIGGIRYECPAAREELAYRAQDQWLRLFGQSLEHTFGIDKFTLKVSTSCGF